MREGKSVYHAHVRASLSFYFPRRHFFGNVALKHMDFRDAWRRSASNL
jgi:hypothetical protein